MEKVIKALSQHLDKKSMDRINDAISIKACVIAFVIADILKNTEFKDIDEEETVSNLLFDLCGIYFNQHTEGSEYVSLKTRILNDLQRNPESTIQRKRVLDAVHKCNGTCSNIEIKEDFDLILDAIESHPLKIAFMQMYQ